MASKFNMAAIFDSISCSFNKHYSTSLGPIILFQNGVNIQDGLFFRIKFTKNNFFQKLVKPNNVATS
jgi:hypothetical protein